jgi:hypothetical protein
VDDVAAQQFCSEMSGFDAEKAAFCSGIFLNAALGLREIIVNKESRPIFVPFWPQIC